MPEGRTLTLHVAADGVGLTISKVEALKPDGTQLVARNVRGDLYVVNVSNVFACALDGAEERGRKAGFSP